MPGREQTDEELMLKVKSDDLDAMVPLFDRYNKRLYNFYLRLTGDEEKCKDLTQTVFSRIIAYRHSFKEGNKFRSWMYRMARNALFDLYNENKLSISHDPVINAAANNNSDANYEFEREQEKEALMEAISLLGEEERQIIELSRFQDLKYSEIAQLTGNSVGAVRVKVHRAINKLRDIYFQIA